MKARLTTVLALAALSLVAACGNSSPSGSDIEAFARAEWGNRVDTVKLVQPCAQLNKTMWNCTFDVAWRPHGGKQFTANFIWADGHLTAL